MTKRGIIEFLNTNLGLWLLSSVALGLISFGYSQLNSHLSAESKRVAQITRVRIEIRQRIAQFEAHVKEIDIPDAEIDLPNEDLKQATISLIAAPNTLKDSRKPIYAAFDEYRERPMISLIIELACLLKPDERINVTPDIDDLAALTPKYLDTVKPAELGKRLTAMFQSPYWKLFDQSF